MITSALRKSVVLMASRSVLASVSESGVQLLDPSRSRNKKQWMSVDS